MYKIEKGVSVPTITRAKQPVKYPWKELAVGDSFLVPTGAVKPQSVRAAVGQANRTYPDRRFTSRTVDGGVRVWRSA